MPLNEETKPSLYEHFYNILALFFSFLNYLSSSFSSLIFLFSLSHMYWSLVQLNYWSLTQEMWQMWNKLDPSSLFFFEGNWYGCKIVTMAAQE